MVVNSIASESLSFLILSRPSSTAKTTHNRFCFPRHQRCHRLVAISSSSSSNSTDGNSATPPVQPTEITPPERTVEIRLRRNSRKRSKLKKDEYRVGAGGKRFPKANASSDPSPPKKWEDMNLTEKAIELYVGEKGLLFWLNKFAYASIFITIGAWILFRFVGPSLNLYQLDAPPLSPTSVFKGPS